MPTTFQIQYLPKGGIVQLAFRVAETVEAAKAAFKKANKTAKVMDCRCVEWQATKAKS